MGNFEYHSIEKHHELDDDFEQICNIFLDAKICFDYANALEYPKKEYEEIIKQEPFMIFRYSCSRLALIELSKLYQKKDTYSLFRIISRLVSKHYGKFENNLDIEEMSKRLETIKVRSEKVIALRDKVFAHQDKKSDIKKLQLYKVGYQDVVKLFSDTRELIDELQRLLQLPPYHKIGGRSADLSQLDVIFTKLIS